MTNRQAKEQGEREQRHSLEWFKTSMEEDPNALVKLAEQHKQQEQDMIARHYKEAKYHPESPDLAARWDDYFRPKGLVSPDEWLRQQKTEQQKIEDELRSAVANEKGVYEKELDQEREAAERQKKLEEDRQREVQESKRKADELIKRLEEEQRRSPRSQSLDFDYDL